MKWKSVTLSAMAMIGLTAGSLLQAADRLPVQQPTLTARRSLPMDTQVQRPILSQISWWAKFGQPVEPPPGAEVPAGDAPVVHDHGYGFGYVYGLGSCDCRPRCIDQLWDGYEQMPWRCSHPVYKDRHGGYGCGACGHGAYGNGSCGHGGCGRGGHGRCGHGFCGQGGCRHAVGCGCTTAAPSCADACDSPCCKPKCKRSKQWFAHWHWGKKCCDTCDSCSAPIGCGCAAPVGSDVPAADAPPMVAPPVPAADEASVLKKPLLHRVSAQRVNVR
jgi:hypothetical protein